MRSEYPMSGNPWPHDMVISVENHSYRLLDLLWVREAWKLEPSGADLPPALSPSPVIEPNVQSVKREKREYHHDWSDLWSDALLNVSTPRSSFPFEALETMSQPDRQEALELLNPPSWRERYGDEPFGDDYREWVTQIPTDPGPLDEQPERRSLPSLIGAWQRGLATVVEIPCAGSYTRVLSPHALLVTAETRSSAADYSRALDSFTKR